MRKTSKKILALVLLPFVVFALFDIASPKETSATYYGGLMVDTGVPHSGPMFTVDDFKPGDCTERNIKVKNTSDHDKDLTVRSANVDQTGDLSDALTIEIKSGSVLYFDSLTNFFDQSQSLDGIILDTLGQEEEKTYTFKVCFLIEAGNEYQKKFVEFDLIFGDKITPVELPEQCKHLSGVVTSTILGDNGNNRIEGTHASELIVSYDGNDRIDGGAGHDCIVTGNGNSRIDGSAGNDVIVTGNGNNRIDDGGAGDDKIYTGAGNDRIGGGSGNDEIHSGAGNDIISGDSGNDKIYAGDGDDRVNGETGTDYINGGAGYDRLNGGTAIDDCDEGEALSNCEL